MHDPVLAPEAAVACEIPTVGRGVSLSSKLLPSTTPKWAAWYNIPRNPSSRQGCPGFSGPIDRPSLASRATWHFTDPLSNPAVLRFSFLAELWSWREAVLEASAAGRLALLALATAAKPAAKEAAATAARGGRLSNFRSALNSCLSRLQLLQRWSWLRCPCSCTQ